MIIMNIIDRLIQIMVDFVKVVEVSLPLDIVKAIKTLIEIEEGITRDIAIAMARNIDIAKTNSIPICQDTGVHEFFVKIGLKNRFKELIDIAIIKAIEKATMEVPLRPNAIDPFTNTNSGNNVGRYIPWIEYEIDNKSDIIEVWLYIAGGGSSSSGEAKTISPIEWEKQLIEFVIEKTLEKGINACPPLVVGIGIGPTIEIASKLSKKALLRDLGKRHDDPYVADLEKKIKEKINSIGIGAQGFNGKILVFDVFIEYAYTHPALRAIAISFGCWAHRKGHLKIYSDMSYEIPTHGIGRKRYD